MPLILGTNSIKDTGFNVDNSLRFNDGSTDYLSKTFSGTQTNNKKCTISCWHKRSATGDTGINGGEQTIISWNTGLGDRSFLRYAGSSDQLKFQIVNDTSDVGLDIEPVSRDISAWTHIVAVVDTTQSTASNRMKLYLNGVQVTDFDASSYPNQNETNIGFGEAETCEIGRDVKDSNTPLDGYLAEMVFIDGQALDPTSFGEFDEDSPRIWKPKDVSDLTFGTNGFYLQFKQSGTSQNSSGLGADTSGNNNHFAVNNLTSVDQSTDTCTNNFATLNSLLPLHSSTFSEGNLKWTPSTASQYYWANSTFGVSQGKWYMEAKLTTAADHNVIGISNDQAQDNTSFLSGSGGEGDDNVAYQYGYKNSNGQSYNNASGSSYGNTYAQGDIIGMYVDLDNNKIYWAKNGTLQNSGTGVSITDPGSIPGGVYFLAVADGTSSNSSVWEVNFGGTNTYSISSGNSDPNGYGNFEYSPNDGGSASFDSTAKDFYALNTKNLAEFG
tara:strand:- start:370 stop:1860 length:1491 start_codon:yes stop_codon:yes gene_type:complete